MDNFTISLLLNATANVSVENSSEAALPDETRQSTGAMHPELVQAILLWKYFPPVLIVIGTLGNIMSVVVMCRKNIWKMASSPYLVVLAVADISVLYTGLLRQWIRFVWEVDIRELSPVACKIHTFLVYVTVDFSVWILVAVSVERFISVCFPFKARSICNRNRAKITMVIILLALLALNSHFLYGLGSLYDDSKDEPELLTHCGMLFDHYIYFYNNTWPWIDLSVFSMVPFVIIIVCNISLIGKVVICKRIKVAPVDSNNGQRTKPSSMTMLLLTLNTTFLLSTAPISIYLIGYPQWISTATNEEAIRLYLWWAVVNFLMYLNNSVNFIFYCVSGRRFRGELREMCGRNNRVGIARLTATMTDVPQLANVPSETNMTRLRVTPM